jgi:putative two-component system response regulator
VHYALLDQEGIQRRRDEQRTSELAVLSDDVVERFRFLLKLRGIASHADLERLGDLAERLAAALDAPRSISRLYRAAAPLRDIGTLVTASDREEWDHARSGHRVLRGSELPALRLAAEIAKAHHEKWDGSGCFGLRAYDIPTPGRVVAVVGAFVDLTAEAPESAEATSRALQQITSRAGEWYDPRMVDVFRTIVEAHMEPGRAHLRVIAQAA